LYSRLNERRVGRGDSPPADPGPDDTRDDPPRPPPATASGRSSVDTYIRISDHALHWELISTDAKIHRQ